MEINFKKISPNAVTPSYATLNSVGADLYALLDDDVIIESNERIIVPTGIMVEIPCGFGGFIFPRSSISTRHGVTLANCVGVIDSDYRGEIKVSLINHSDFAYEVKNKDRIAQLVIMPVETVAFKEKNVLSCTLRGEGGFGSTGK